MRTTVIILRHHALYDGCGTSERDARNPVYQFACERHQWAHEYGAGSTDKCGD
jgi:hypothetical protein